jgi:outer membrane protein assembly factor BamB
MHEADRPGVELENDEELQITDLDPRDSRQHKRAGKMIAVLHRGFVTPWIRYVLLVLLIIVLVGVVVLPQWLLLNRNAQPEATPGPSAVASPSLTGFNGVISEHQVYIQGNDKSITAYQAETGRVLWHKQFPGSAFMQATDQVLYCYFVTTQGKGELEALRAGDGRVMWTYVTLSRPGPSSLRLDGDAIYAGSNAGTIYALQASNGRLRWTFHYSQASDGPAFPLDASLVVEHGIAEIRSLADDRLHILSARDGREIMRLAFPNDNGSPFLQTDGQFIYGLPSPGTQNIQVFQATDGKLLWGSQISGEIGAITEDNGLIFLIGTDGSVRTFRGSDGRVLWDYVPAVAGTTSGEAPVENNGMLYLFLQTPQSNTLVSVRESNGQVTWSTPVSGLTNGQSLNLTLLFADGMVFLQGTTPGEVPTQQLSQVYALQASTGKELWYFSLEENTALSLSFIFLQASTFYTGQPDGTIEAWRDSDGKHLWSTQTDDFALSPWLNPQANPELLFLINESGNLDVLRGSDGQVLWRHQVR